MPAAGYSLLLGGVRSGKSRLAVDLAEASGRAVVFVATAEAGDDDMTRRIAAHRSERPADWTTVEAPRDLVGPLRRADRDAFVVVDCITVWVANLFLADVTGKEIVRRAEELADALGERTTGAVVVTNEVGMGVHPSTELGRHYRDLLGTVNVRLCASARTAALIVAGRALRLLPAAEMLG